jgi:hypothetical protein
MTRFSLGLLALAIVPAMASAIAGPFAAAAHAQPSTVAGTPYNPRLGDLMNTIVQPRHAKLGLAGQAGNWPLAAYALAELEQAFRHVGETWPTWRRISLPDMIEQVAAEPMRAVDRAIKAHDAAQFAAAYAQLTAACNACHTSLGHAFIVIKTPDGSSFPNQDFSPQAK